ncbi:MAG TPA: ABC transporter permease [Vicinamibacterales bacterium]|nr:ABC transporter permease [Vicinamibacterales bacterium]
MARDELRQAWRALGAHLPFAATAVLITALAIGANTAVFSLVNAVLVSPLPFPHASQLVEVTGRRLDVERDPISLPDYLDLRDGNRSFAVLAAAFQWSANVTGGEAERLQGMRATSNLFTALGTQAALGRTLVPDDESGAARRVVVLSHGLWKRRFGADPNVLGLSIVLNGDAYSVVGVLPSAFVYPVRDADLVAPFPTSTDPRRTSRDLGFLRVIGRLRAGVTIEQARQDLDGIVARLRAEYPITNATHAGTTVAEWHSVLVARVRPLLLLLQAAVALVLAVACANLANLFLVAAIRREREFAVRSALGASRARLVREVFAESGLIAIAGCLGGVLLGSVARRMLLALAPGDLLTISNDAALDRHVIAFALTAATIATISFAAIPAWRLATGTLGAHLRDGTRTTGSIGRTARRWLVGIEIALAAALITMTVLLSQSFARLQSVDPGFRADHLLTVRMSLPRGRYRTRADVVRFTEELRSKLLGIRGVDDAAAVNVVPLNGYRATVDFWPADRPEPPAAERPEAHYRMVGPSYLSTFGVPLIQGRALDEHDTSISEPVIVINQTIAHRYWRGRSPVGEYLVVRDTGDNTVRRPRIVGVVGDVKHFGLDTESTADLYIAIPQVPEPSIQWLANNMYWGVRTTGEPAAVRKSVRREIKAVDNDVPASMRTMDDMMEVAVAPRRLNLWLVRVFGIAALTLAAAGIYAVTAFSVSIRTREIGIRAILGARPLQNFTIVIADVSKPMLAGLAAGVLLSLAAAPALRTFLFAVNPVAPLTIALVSALLLSVGVLAALIGAWRLKSIDPVIALRTE